MKYDYLHEDDSDPDPDSYFNEEFPGIKPLTSDVGTLVGPTVGDDFYENYGSIFDDVSGPHNQHKNITTFEQIGLQDPFPSEPPTHRFKHPVRFDDFVYPPSKLAKNESPKLIYVPSSWVLFKLMRACIDVDEV